VIYDRSARSLSTVVVITTSTTTERATTVSGGMGIAKVINKWARKVGEEGRRTCIISSDLCPKNQEALTE